MERVGETVAAVDRPAEAALHLEQRRERDVRGEHQRAGGRGGDDGAVDGGVAGRPAPRHVALPAVRRRDAPDVLGVAGELTREAAAERLVRARRGHRVREPVHPAGPALAAPPEIHPGMRVLVHEQRIRMADVSEASERHGRTRPRRPRLGGDGVAGRPDGQQVENHQLAVARPPRVEESRLRPPAVRQQGGVAGQHPPEIHPAVDRVRVADDVRIRVEAAADGQHAGEEQRGVDGGKLALPLAGPAAEVDEVEEPAAFVRHPLGEEAQRRTRAPHGLRAGQPAALGGDAQPAQAEPDRRDAADVVHRRPVGPRSIAHDAGGGVRLLPEEQERAARQVFEKRVVPGAECRVRRGRRGLRPGTGSRAGDGAREERRRDEARGEAVRSPSHRPAPLGVRRRISGRTAAAVPGRSGCSAGRS